MKGRSSQAHGGFPGKFDSSNLSRDNVSRKIGHICRNGVLANTAKREAGNIIIRRSAVPKRRRGKRKAGNGKARRERKAAETEGTTVLHMIYNVI